MLPDVNLETVEVKKAEEVEDEEEKHTDTPERDKVFALKFMLAPDLSSVGYFKPDDPGSNIGMMLEYYLGKRWSISGGAIRSRKIYFTDDALDIGRYASNPNVSRVDAACTVD